MICATRHILQTCFTSKSSTTPKSLIESTLSMDPQTIFTKQEDELLRELVKRHGTKKWHIISAKMHNKTPRECRRRWRTYLHMCMNKSSWSEEEDLLLIKGHNAYGNRWTEIAKMVPCRTDNAVKNRYNALCKKRSHCCGEPLAFNGLSTLELCEASDELIRDIAKRGKKLKNREDGMGLFMPNVGRNSCAKRGLSIEIPGDSDILRVEGSQKPRSPPRYADPTSFVEIRDSTAEYSTSPKVDMDEVMGWLLARTPTPTCNGSGDTNSTITSSTPTSPCVPRENIGCTHQSNVTSVLTGHNQQLSSSPTTPTSIQGHGQSEFGNLVS